jgi:uncharacterized membrane protein YeaQ/YmgE (transglycosylase-associated protein family)
MSYAGSSVNGSDVSYYYWRTKRRRVGMLGALLFWIIVGLIAGVIAKFALPGDDPGGIIVTIVIGIVGAVLGGWLLSLLGIGGGAGSGGVDI